MKIDAPPGFIVSLLTFGIARARWIAETNRRLGRGGAHGLFAWFLPAFANYGLASRMTAELESMGARSGVSPIA